MQTSLTASRLAALPKADRAKALASLTDDEARELLGYWPFWARPEQLPPPGNWAGWLILAGRGYGKTRVGAEYVTARVRAGQAERVGLIAETAADARSVVVEGESGLIAVGERCGFKPRYEPSKRLLTWPNGAIALTFNGTEPDQLRGPQHDLIWFDELAKYQYPQEAFDQAMFGLRLGADPRWIATTTPRPIPLLRALIQRADVHVTKGKTLDNIANLAPTFRANVIDRYAGTRLGRQELDAEILDDAPGALWVRRNLDSYRVSEPPPLKRIVVGVDPAVSANEGSNETGIVCAGVAENGHVYVLDDASGVMTPDQWARRVMLTYRAHEADSVVVEVNQGGDLVRANIKAAAPHLTIREVRASRGKYVRAEPIAALYEQGRVHHVGTFAALEDQMCVFTPDRDGEGSPDRVDALVWALTDLLGAVSVAARSQDTARIRGPVMARDLDYLERTW